MKPNPQNGTTVFKATATTESGTMVLRLEGRLADQWVDELSRATGALTPDGAGVTFDLGGISYIDARGVAWLRGARDRGARLMGGSSFIAALIEDRTP